MTRAPARPFHADFLAGHLELAQATGAWIGYGQRAEADHPIRALADEERVVLGDVVLQILETPGHTPESISAAVFEHAADEVPYGILTGDALFIGDVGRPDLPASIGVTADELGQMLYASIRKLMAAHHHPRAALRTSPMRTDPARSASTRVTRPSVRSTGLPRGLVKAASKGVT